ncbi:hypothetical protein [Corallococcus exercitus]|uniref:hypothetical protein n=1 Tax=Corallococcus exercitus TaxID=2316736 RepID=UPI001ABF38D4|nr:hypothetical protein [Corallococcus exercitus]
MDLLRFISAAQQSHSPEELWSTQKLLLEAHRHIEKIIRKRRTVSLRIKNEKLKYSRSPTRSIDRIHRFDSVINSLEHSEARCRSTQAALRYVGDSLCHRLVPEHHLSALSRGRAGSGVGFIFDKDGLELELECAQAIVDRGNYAILADLTHCLTIADILSITPNGMHLIECKKSNSKQSSLPRLNRQDKRAKIISELLTNETIDVSTAQREELGLHTLPSHFVESNRSNDKYHISDFIEACSVSGLRANVIIPEQGLAYIACAEGAFTGDIASRIPWGHSGSQLLFGWLNERISGSRPYIPTLLNLGIPAPLLNEVLTDRIAFFTIIDVSTIQTGLQARGVEAGPLLTREDGCWWDVTTPKTRLTVKLSARRLEAVSYGLMSLSSALDIMAELVCTSLDGLLSKAKAEDPV